ncbi:MAG: hypothetical protein KAU95_04190 [Candidatus Aenigmarchaeota archaeon]|nr:hypothetical protein [Candidatus Aenigmarchaeota archaeon]
MGKEPIAFFVRCKPQGQEIIDLVINYEKVPIGYGPLKKIINNSEFQISKLDTWLYDIRNHEKDFEEKDTLHKWKKHYNTFKNLIGDVSKGSLVLIPRPEKGICYIGKVDKYEFEYDAGLHKAYKKLRMENSEKLKKAKEDVWGRSNKKICEQVKDVVQYWKVSNIKDISFVKIPGWIRRSLFGRGTLARIKDADETLNAYKILDKIYQGNSKFEIISKKEDDTATIKEKLYNFLTPEIFEHFICNLLFLEFSPEQFWWHVGGSGDGGVDCMGFNEEGETTGIAQCKLQGNSVKELIRIGKEMREKIKNSGDKDIKIIVCDFYCTKEINSTIAMENIEIYNQEKILKLFEKHKKKSNYWGMIGLKH